MIIVTSAASFIAAWITYKHRSKIDIWKMRAIFQSFWVRKLIGKPAFLTIADCESEARRIHNYDAALSPCAAESNAFSNRYGLRPMKAVFFACIFPRLG